MPIGRAGRTRTPLVPPPPRQLPLAAPPPDAPPAAEPTKAKKIKMSSIIDQGDESEFTAAPATRIRLWFKNYVDLMKGQPTEEETPTNDQLSAMEVKVFIHLGSPYADFAVWTPYARKTARAHKFTAYLPQPDGTWLAREVPGPANIEAWLFCWNVFRSACIMLKVAAAAPLDRYQKKVEKLARQWPSCWHLIFLAEDKARYEHFNRLKSMIEFDIEAGRPAPPMWDAEAPWNAIFLMAAENDDKYWDENVRHPAMSWLAHGAKGAPKANEEVVADAVLAGGAAALAPVPSVPRGSCSAAPPPVPGAWGQGNSRGATVRRQKRELSSSGAPTQAADAGKGWGKAREPAQPARGRGKGAGAGAKGARYTTDQTGLQLCFLWNSGADPCAQLPPGAPCPNGRQHKCTTCRSDQHPARSCPSA